MKPWIKKVAWGLGIVAVGAGLIVLVKKATRNEEDDGQSPGATSNATDDTAPAVKPATVKNSSFPLQNGSNNKYVGDLQRALGITADNIFGPNTENALSKAAGVTFVKDEAQLNEIIKNITSKTATASRAQDLFNKYLSGNYSIQGLVTKNWLQVQKDAYGAYNYTGKQISLYKGTTYNKDDYSIKDFTKGGNVIVEINKGAAMGTYIGDPNAITLV